MKKKIMILLCCLMMISALLLTACNGRKAEQADSQDPGPTTEEPFSELDFEEEVTVPIGENEDVGGL